MNELQLIEGCRKGERRAQKELYDAYSRKMMGVCLIIYILILYSLQKGDVQGTTE